MNTRERKKLGYGQKFHEERLSGWGYCAAIRHVVFDPLGWYAQFYGQTGRAGTKAANQPDKILRCAVAGRHSVQSWYRYHVAPVRCGKFKKLSADGNAEANGLKAVSYTHLTLPTKA